MKKILLIQFVSISIVFIVSTASLEAQKPQKLQETVQTLATADWVNRNREDAWDRLTFDKDGTYKLHIQYVKDLSTGTGSYRIENDTVYLSGADLKSNSRTTDPEIERVWGGKSTWLLVKRRDEWQYSHSLTRLSPSPETYPKSLWLKEEVAAGTKIVWQQHEAIRVIDEPVSLIENSRVRTGPGLDYKPYEFIYYKFGTEKNQTTVLPKRRWVRPLLRTVESTYIDGLGSNYWYYCEFSNGNADSSKVKYYKAWIFGGLLNNQNTAFIHAIRNGDLAAVKKFIQEGSDPNTRLDEHFQTPVLDLAIREGYVEIAKYLVEAGADPDVRYGYRSTPLMAAAAEGELGLMKYLVEKGADVFVRNRGGESILLIARGTWVLNKDDPNREARNKNYLEIIKYLLELGVDVNIKSYEGDTALHSVVRKDGGLSVIKYLVEAGADIHAQNYLERTPVFVAVQQGALESVKYLLAQGADINHKDSNNRNLLDWAIDQNEDEVASYLRSLGAKCNAECGM